MKKRLLIIVPIILVIAIVAWFVVNPIGRFGYRGFGVTVYGSFPYAPSDIQVRANGEIRKVEKTHELTYEDVKWLLQSEKPDVLFIGTGWQGKVNADDKIKNIDGVDVRIMKTGEAVEEFDKLKGEGRKVAIHVHSTC